MNVHFTNLHNVLLGEREINAVPRVGENVFIRSIFGDTTAPVFEVNHNVEKNIVSVKLNVDLGGDGTK